VGEVQDRVQEVLHNIESIRDSPDTSTAEREDGNDGVDAQPRDKLPDGAAGGNEDRREQETVGGSDGRLDVNTSEGSRRGAWDGGGEGSGGGGGKGTPGVCAACDGRSMHGDHVEVIM